MSELMKPIATQLNFDSKMIEPYDNKVVRRLSDMVGMYADKESAEKMLKIKDVLLYEVYEVKVPEEAGQLQYCISITYPGKVGEEYFMTKGHFHTREDTAEIYFCLQGEGYMLMETKEGQVSAIPMLRGTIVYVPPYWAHRSVNTGTEKLISFCVYPGDAGHDYGTIEKKGFRKIIVERNGKPELIDNPQYK